MSKPHILMVLTSHSRLGDTGKKTGFWVEEFAAPYYVFLDGGAEITLASPEGGQPPIDPNSQGKDAATAATARFDKDPEAKERLAHTCQLADVKAEQFDGVFYPGGHGPLWDLTRDPDSIALIEAFLQAGKPVSSVCHAPAVLLDVKDPDGRSVLENRKVTGFSNTEEEAVGLSEVVPFLLEDELKRRGGQYEKGSDWAEFAVEDGLLITGQNPASSALVARKLLARLQK